MYIKEKSLGIDGEMQVKNAIPSEYFIGIGIKFSDTPISSLLQDIYYMTQPTNPISKLFSKQNAEIAKKQLIYMITAK